MHASHTFSHLCAHAGLLLTHIDELLLYADVDASEGIAGSKYALAEQLLPHLEFYVSRLDMVCLCLCVSICRHFEDYFSACCTCSCMYVCAYACLCAYL